jgi:ADP-ribose pyrophosphatase YjhB (NUDIX family)
MTDFPPSPFYRVSIKGLIFDETERLLVVRGDDDLWEVPGGGWEHGESMQHCLRRELMEELHAAVEHIDFSTIFPWAGPRSKGGMSLKLAVYARLESFEFTVGDSITEYKFVTATELAQLDMGDAEAGVKTQIDRIWAGHRL